MGSQALDQNLYGCIITRRNIFSNIWHCCVKCKIVNKEKYFCINSSALSCATNWVWWHLSISLDHILLGLTTYQKIDNFKEQALVQGNEQDIFWNYIRQASTFWQFSFQYAFNSLPLMHILTYFVYYKINTWVIPA